ncbi:MAG TPA: DUF4157 domain-containing protein [Candidatus Binatia bacterium]|nr:DUF4157 domain-containing protein [Candidatus Binatia bacterium]
MRTFAQKQPQPQKPASSSLARANIATRGLDHRVHPFFPLQRTGIGNQALQRMVQTNAKELKAGLNSPVSPLVGHDFSRIPIHLPTAGAIQTKLLINKAGDEYEQEADRVAEKVMNVPAALSPIPALSSSASVYPSSALQPPGIEGLRSGSLRPRSVETEKSAGNTLTQTPQAVLQRKVGAVAESSPKSSLQEGEKKAELEFHSTIAFRNINSGSSSTGPSEEGFTFLQFQWTVWNAGWETAPEHVDRVTMYKADRCSGCRDEKDELLSMNVTAPSTVPITQPGEGEFKYEAISSIVGMTLPAGHYDVYVDLDVYDEVEEINEDNNTIFTTFFAKPRNKPEPDTEGEEETIQRKGVGPAPEAGPGVESQLRDLNAGGQPLARPLRDFFEPRLGYDFGRVRLHTDARAAESARQLQAKAFTVGRDVFFGAGQYAVEKPEGRHLLAHELTHVAQQTQPPPFNERRPVPSSSSLLAHKPAHRDSLD